MTGATDARPGENLLVVGTDAAALSFCLEAFEGAGELLVVATDVPPSTIEAAAPPGLALRIVNVTDHPPAPGIETVTVGTLPEAGETIARALAEDGVTSLCFDSVSGLVAATSLSETYRFLFLLTSRVSAEGVVGRYTVDSPLDPKERAILGRLFDRQVEVDAEGIAVSDPPGTPGNNG